jgi:hypothetical protein
VLIRWWASQALRARKTCWRARTQTQTHAGADGQTDMERDGGQTDRQTDKRTYRRTHREAWEKKKTRRDSEKGGEADNGFFEEIAKRVRAGLPDGILSYQKIPV